MDGSSAKSPRIVWAPQSGPQKALIDCPVPEILYGGARGGGKTDGIIGKYGLKQARYGKHFNGIIFRPEMPQQDDLIARAKQIYIPLGAKWREQHRSFTFAAGGMLRFRPLESVEDASKYQGQNLTDAAVEEAGNYPSSEPIDMLWGALRSAEGVPTQLLLSANPGGVGHTWIKQRYIEPYPLGMKILKRRLPDGTDHQYVYIPSRVTDNQELLRRDPGYVSRLHLVGSQALVKAWLEGDWNVIAGAFFDCWNSAKHIIEPFQIPPHWTRFGSFDWGSAKPFSYGLWAVSDGSIIGQKRDDGKVRQYPAGAMIRYREWYGASGPNVGLKLTNTKVAEGIVTIEHGEPINYRVADPACWKVDGGPSHAEEMAKAPNRIIMRPADNSRVSGWQQVRDRLIGDDDPMLYVFAHCKDFIRCLPAAQHDKTKPEDIDTDGEDHVVDETRYACMSRPYTRKPDIIFPLRGTAEMTMDEVWEHAAPKPQRDQRI